LFGPHVSRSNVCTHIVENPAGVGPKQLIHCDRDPLRLLNLLGDLFEEVALDGIGGSLDHRDEQAFLSQLALDRFSEPDLHKVNRFFRRIFRY